MLYNITFKSSTLSYSLQVMWYVFMPYCGIIYHSCAAESLSMDRELPPDPPEEESKEPEVRTSVVSTSLSLYLTRRCLLLHSGCPPTTSPSQPVRRAFQAMPSSICTINILYQAGHGWSAECSRVVS